MKIQKQDEEKVINFGALGYDAKRISVILGVDESLVLSEIEDNSSELSLLLEKGQYISEYIVDLKLFDMAKTGDMKAIEILEQRKHNRNNTKYRIK